MKQGIGSRKKTSVTVAKWKHPTFKYRVSWIQGGNARDKGFHRKKDAEAWAEEKEAELLAFGPLSDLTHDERSTVIDTRADLSRADMTLRNAVNIALDRHAKESVSDVPVSDLIQIVLRDREKAGRSERYLQDIQSRSKPFESAFGSRLVSSIERSEIETWLDSLGVAPRTRNNYLNTVRLLFNDAVSRKLCDENPATEITESKIIQKEAGIFTPEQMTEFIKVVDSSLLPAVLLSGFAGIRREEVSKLRWNAVNMAQKTIYISAEIAKLGKIRYVPIEDNLLEWLTPYADLTGPIWPPDGDGKLSRARAALKKKGHDTPENALRHSYGSYHLAEWNDINQTAQNMGNSPKMILESYRKAVPKSVASAYWSISPDPGNVVRFEKVS